MYPQKVLQGVPNLKRAVKNCILYFLIVIKCQPQLVRYLLLRHTSRLAGGFKVFSRQRSLLFLPPLRGVMHCSHVCGKSNRMGHQPFHRLPQVHLLSSSFFPQTRLLTLCFVQPQLFAIWVCLIPFCLRKARTFFSTFIDSHLLIVANFLTQHYCIIKFRYCQ